MKLDEVGTGSIHLDANVLDFDRVTGLERHWIINPPDPQVT